MHKSFSTRNVLHPYDSMEIGLVSGPMRHMQGKWQFVPVKDHACKVLLDLEFEFSGSFLSIFSFNPCSQSIANSLVDAFLQARVELYGQVNNEG